MLSLGMLRDIFAIALLTWVAIRHHQSLQSRNGDWLRFTYWCLHSVHRPSQRAGALHCSRQSCHGWTWT